MLILICQLAFPDHLLGLVQLAEIGRGWGLVTDLEYIQLNTWDLRHCSILYTVHSAINTISPLQNVTLDVH